MDRRGFCLGSDTLEDGQKNYDMLRQRIANYVRAGQNFLIEGV